MTPILLHTNIIPPGTKQTTDEWAYLFENKKAAYLPDREENQTPGPEFCEFPEDGNFPEFGIVDLTTTETIFVIEDAQDFQEFTAGHRTRNEWAVEYMTEDSFKDFSENIKAVYEDILKLILPKPLQVLRGLPSDSDHFDPAKKTPYPATMLTLWKVHTSRDWESQFDEVDAFSYKGPAIVTSITPS